MRYKTNIEYIGDCPNQRDFDRIVENFSRAVRMQEEAGKNMSKDKEYSEEFM